MFIYIDIEWINTYSTNRMANKYKHLYSTGSLILLLFLFLNFQLFFKSTLYACIYLIKQKINYRRRKRKKSWWWWDDGFLIINLFVEITLHSKELKLKKVKKKERRRIVVVCWLKRKKERKNVRSMRISINSFQLFLLRRLKGGQPFVQQLLFLSLKKKKETKN